VEQLIKKNVDDVRAVVGKRLAEASIQRQLELPEAPQNVFEIHDNSVAIDVNENVFLQNTSDNCGENATDSSPDSSGTAPLLGVRQYEYDTLVAQDSDSDDSYEPLSLREVGADDVGASVVVMQKKLREFIYCEALKNGSPLLDICSSFFGEKTSCAREYSMEYITYLFLNRMRRKFNVKNAKVRSERCGSEYISTEQLLDAHETTISVSVSDRKASASGKSGKKINGQVFTAKFTRGACDPKLISYSESNQT
jgi:hypothetical protein